MTKRTLSDHAYFTLAALTDGPRHGYALIKLVADLSEGRLRLPVGTLYGILDRLSAQGAIEVDHEEVVDSRLRRYYRLTDDGRHLLSEAAAEKAADARIATERLARLRPGIAGSA